MDGQNERGGDLAAAVAHFIEAADAVWTAYQANGPGKVERSLFDPVEVAQREVSALLDDSDLPALAKQIAPDDVDDWVESLKQSIDQAGDLAERCARRPEGLCFITGEAGLVPRRDMHAAFEQAMEALRTQCDLLRDAGSSNSATE